MPESMGQVARARTRVFSAAGILIHLLLQTSVYSLENSVTNMAFHDYSSHTFTADELYVLGQGLNFVPTPQSVKVSRSDFNRFERSVYLGDYFHELDTAGRSPDQECPPNFRIPNPSWHPRKDAEDYVPSEGVPEFCEEVLTDLNCRAELRPHWLPNLSRKHVDTIRRLKEDEALTIVDSDKNLGPVAIDTDVYIERVRREMADTHIIDHRDADDILASICDRMEAELKPELGSLPSWAAEYVEESFSHHPRTREPYRIPGCHDLLKVHKPVLGDRLVTGNHCVATQPGSGLLAELSDPIVRATPTYVQDAVSCIRMLMEQRVVESTLVITYDVVKLYPSIVHDLCLESVDAELSVASVPWLRFALVPGERLSDASAPMYQERDRLLQAKSKETDSRLFALILTYSYALARLRLPEIIHRHKDLLPRHLQSATFIQAWRNPRSLGRTLIPFTLHEHDPPAAPLTPAM